jgi:hypothetical protein
MARPMLPVKITNPANKLSILQWGIIDTGADECALPAWIAQQLGHNLAAGQSKQIGTGNGTTMAYAHTTIIEIFKLNGTGLIDTSTVVHTIPNTPIDYMPNLHCVLLGVKNFLGNFKLTIDYPQTCFSIQNSAPSANP